MHTDPFNPSRAESHLPLPQWTANKKVNINITNDDNKCYLWRILRALNPKNSHADSVDKALREMENSINMKGIAYPVTILNISRFEKQNPKISVNVYAYHDRKDSIYPLGITDDENLIMLTYSSLKTEKKTHYALIKNLEV